MAARSATASVIGSGPNGLAAAIVLAQARLSVNLYEAAATVGGGMRSAELTLPGFIHDVCSAIHPLGAGSPYFQTLPLAKYGLDWIYPPAALAHPLDDGTAVILERSIECTANGLGIDRQAYIHLMKPLVEDWPLLAVDLLGPLGFPKHPIAMAKFGLLAIRSAEGLLHSRFKEPRAQALFAGLAGHSMLSLDSYISAAFGLVLGILGHVTGWPFAKSGSQTIANALAAYFISLGGNITTNTLIDRIDQLPSSELILCDTSPRALEQLAGNKLPDRYRKQLTNYRYGPGIFKVDWALSAPIPWKAKDCALAATVHLGGSAEEIIACEKQVAQGSHPEKPFIILAQQSLYDNTRTPPGKHTAWGYCHVPNGSTVDMRERIESQIERFAPGFKNIVLGRHTINSMQIEQYNPNYVGGDINGGVQDIRQLFFRPAPRWVPYSTPIEGLYLCSASTPPGGGVHGMCGYHAAKAAILNVIEH